MSENDNGKSHKKKRAVPWAVKILLITFIISAAFSFISTEALAHIRLVPAVFILLLFIAIGILFDIIGVAVTAADETPFHSMAAKKVPAADTAIYFIRNAEKVSNFCNDVIGDICGVISGSTGAVIVAYLARSGFSKQEAVFSIVISALIASLTVFGKACGKGFAIASANRIVFFAAKIAGVFSSFFRR